MHRQRTHKNKNRKTRNKYHGYRSRNYSKKGGGDVPNAKFSFAPARAKSNPTSPRTVILPISPRGVILPMSPRKRPPKTEFNGPKTQSDNSPLIKQQENQTYNNIIGKGSFGCVVKPSLTCKGEETVPGKVSKIMLKKNAEIELGEYSKIDEIDPDFKYHFQAKTCEPVYDETFDSTLQSCNLEGDMEKYVLLNFDDGGYDLEQVCKYIKTDQDIINIWKSMLNIFEAVKMFSELMYVHHDIKPLNIVYNRDTTVMK
jgi:hypothetical protein